MITKTQLTDGFKFTYGSEIYRLKEPIWGDYFYVIKENNDKTSQYVGNIETIEDEYFTIYTYVMGRKIKVKINYDECELAIAD